MHVLGFDREQHIANIAGIEIGGQPGELPAVLIGSIFFRAHRIVRDAERGEFDLSRAYELLKREEEFSLATGVPRMIDVVGETAEALVRYVTFVAEHSRAPILLDSPSWQVRVEALGHATADGLAERIVYNSLGPHYHPQELEAIARCGVKSAVVLAFDTNHLQPASRVELLTGDGSAPGLLAVAGSAGIDNVLVDCGTLDVPTVSWTARAIWEVKRQTGLPAGCAPANGLYQWTSMRAKGSRAFEAAASVVCALPQAYGANFLFYGSLANAPWAYHACEAMHTMLACEARLKGTKPRSRDRLLSDVPAG